MTASPRPALRLLAPRMRGELDLGPAARAAYATDASLYRIPPLGVAFPRDEDDVRAIVAFAAERRLPLLPRGGGTSLAGQAVGEALILDFRRHMARLIEVDTARRLARAQPGLVLDELNRALAPMGLIFGPDVASSSRATIGGMVANNSAGARSIVYGSTVDHLHALRVVASDGRAVRLAVGATWAEAEAKARAQSARAGDGVAALATILDGHRAEIDRVYPKIVRRVGGYGLDRFPPGEPPNPARIICGAEGTLATVTEIELRLVPIPARRGLVVCHFADLARAMEAVAPLLAVGPSAVELIDRTLLDLARRSPVGAMPPDLLAGDPDCLLIVEFFADGDAEMRAKIAGVESAPPPGLARAPRPVTDPREQAGVWAMRKNGLGMLMGRSRRRGLGGESPTAKPISFVEDAAVDPTRLPSYVRGLREVFGRHDVQAVFYAHASVGLLHVRPILDLRTAADVRRMKAIAREVCELVLAHGGAMSGEHGDGLVRGWLNRRIFGETLCAAFDRLRRAWDPDGLFNPGKVLVDHPMDADLRLTPAPPPATPSVYRYDGGMFAETLECSGVGNCQQLAGFMCPSFRATGDELHSPRGRANLAREVLAGNLPGETLGGESLHRAMDLCLGCNACVRECPSNVDIPKLKQETLAARHRLTGVPLGARLLADLPRLARLGAALPGLTRFLSTFGPARALLERVAGIDRRRPLPLPARERFSRWFRRRRASGDSQGAAGEVAFFNDCFTEAFDPAPGRAAVALLERAGYRVTLAPAGCCGRAHASVGLLREARRLARANVERLLPLVERGVAIVGCEPSCVFMIREESPLFFDGPPREAARRVAAGVEMADEFLLRTGALDRLPLRPLGRDGSARRILVHGHCHQKAAGRLDSGVAALRKIPGSRVEAIESTCCGMAGGFGFTHYDLSRRVAELDLLPALRAAREGDVVIAAAGLSCRQQIAHFEGRAARHPLELLYDALAD
ncbi:MAG: FAD-binding oxidoreductase [Planctomycetes bacterium]|nr:FAD-binding oxidoreductase [Planctomycetota bacterium]